MPGLHEQRHEVERLIFLVDTFLQQVIPGITLSEKIQARKRLVEAGITVSQANQLLVRCDSLGSDDHERLAAFRKYGVPAEIILDYVSAPDTRSSSDVPVREDIYNRVISNHRQLSPLAIEGGLGRTSYVGGFLAACSSITFLGVRLASFNEQAAWYVRPMAQMFDQVERFVPNLSNAMGQDVVNTLSELVPGSGAALLGASVLAALHQHAKYRSRLAGLASTLNNTTSGVAQQMFGDYKQDKVLSRYRRLSEGEKHLLSHLSAHELRVVLIGGPQAAREVLDARPISYEQQAHALAHDCHGRLDFIAKMMELSLPEFMKAPARAVLSRWLSAGQEDRGIRNLVWG